MKNYTLSTNVISRKSGYKSLWKEKTKLPPLSLDDNFALVRKVQVTPSNIFFLGAQVMQSNCILRSYPECQEHFLWVSFIDEDGKKLQRTSIVNPSDGTKTKIYERISNTILNGICIGNKHFVFLAFSTTQLHENSLLMFSAYGKLTLLKSGIRWEILVVSKIWPSMLHEWANHCLHQWRV